MDEWREKELGMRYDDQVFADLEGFRAVKYRHNLGLIHPHKDPTDRILVDWVERSDKVVVVLHPMKCQDLISR
jgi:hypothetical protein